MEISKVAGSEERGVKYEKGAMFKHSPWVMTQAMGRGITEFEMSLYRSRGVCSSKFINMLDSLVFDSIVINYYQI
jgi:hypothetical protein